MKIAVRYYTGSGNTKKLARVVADADDCQGAAAFAKKIVEKGAVPYG